MLIKESRALKIGIKIPKINNKLRMRNDKKQKTKETRAIRATTHLQATTSRAINQEKRIRVTHMKRNILAEIEQEKTWLIFPEIIGQDHPKHS